MKPNRNISLLVTVALLSITLAGCPKTPTLEAGGPYSSVANYEMDRSILDGVKVLNDFTAWTDANSAYLTANAPQVMTLAVQIKANKDMWETQALNARSAYASSVKAYNDAVAAAKANNTPLPDGSVVATAHDKLLGAMAVIQNLLPVIAQFRSTVVIKTS